MKKTVISIVAQFSLPDTWTPPDRRRDNQRMAGAQRRHPPRRYGDERSRRHNGSVRRLGSWHFTPLPKTLISAQIHIFAPHTPSRLHAGLGIAAIRIEAAQGSVTR
jgi:hypothetical protein